jgi:hypothetical protein
MWLRFAFALLVSVTTSQALSGEAECEAGKKVVGDCFKVHGRLRTYNGIGQVIWWIGTKRDLAVGGQELPGVLKNCEAFGVDCFGDFEVCPISVRREGEMQWVCVKSGANVVMVDHRPEDKGQKAIVRKLDGRANHN